MGSLGMAREELQVKVAHWTTEARRDVKHVIARLKGRIWTLQTDVRLRCKKMKKLLRRMWKKCRK